MTYLDVSPMIHALSANPEQFEFKSGSLHHLPSRHRFQFDEGRVRVDAHCDCAFLNIEPEQERTLCHSFQVWHASYWRSIEINREFASHFAPSSGIAGAFIYAASALESFFGRVRAYLLRKSCENPSPKLAQIRPAF